MGKEKVIILHGMNSWKIKYNQIIKRLSEKYEVCYFKWSSFRSIEDNVKRLEEYIQKKNMEKVNFVTHSFGSVIFKVYSKDNYERIEKSVQIAPVSDNPGMLKAFYDKLPRISWIIGGKAGVEFVKNSKKIAKIRLPKNVGVIAGNKGLDFTRIEDYIIPLFWDNRNSDGKVSVEGAKLKGMKDFIVVNDHHDKLPKNPMVIAQILNFLERGRFNHKI